MKCYLIVAHEVTNDGSDRGQLVNMADQARSDAVQQLLRAWLSRLNATCPCVGKQIFFVARHG